MSEQTRQGLPKIDFSTFILSLFTAAEFHLGEIPDPDTGKFNKDMDMAKETIDIIMMLREKTSNNLTTDEEKLLENLLSNLQMTFVRKS
ncbi:MAG: DUF1844 domain-containing protein [bacterium]|nr:DUF1844 domain-containing protein [bacterium]